MPFFSTSRRALLGLLACVLLCSSVAQAAPRFRFVRGYIIEIRTGLGLQYVTVEEDGVPITLVVNARTSINPLYPLPPSENPTPDASLGLGHFVEAWYGPANRVAHRIDTTLTRIVTRATGTLIKAEPISLDTDGDAIADLILRTESLSSSLLLLGSTPVEETQLPLLEGLPADLLIRISPYYHQVERLRIELPGMNRVSARVAEVNASNLSLTLRHGTQTRPVVVAAGARITAQGRSIPLEAVQAGDTARVVTTTVPTGHSILLQMDLESPRLKTLRGRPTAIDLEARTMTVTTPRGAFTFHVPVDRTISLREDHGGRWGVPWPSWLPELQYWLVREADLRVELEYLQRADQRVATQILAIVKIAPPPPPRAH